MKGINALANHDQRSFVEGPRVVLGAAGGRGRSGHIGPYFFRARLFVPASCLLPPHTACSTPSTRRPHLPAHTCLFCRFILRVPCKSGDALLPRWVKRALWATEPLRARPTATVGISGGLQACGGGLQPTAVRHRQALRQQAKGAVAPPGMHGDGRPASDHSWEWSGSMPARPQSGAALRLRPAPVAGPAPHA
jgi:hypothetical protein